MSLSAEMQKWFDQNQTSRSTKPCRRRLRPGSGRRLRSQESAAAAAVEVLAAAAGLRRRSGPAGRRTARPSAPFGSRNWPRRSRLRRIFEPAARASFLPAPRRGSRTPRAPPCCLRAGQKPDTRRRGDRYLKATPRVGPPQLPLSNRGSGRSRIYAEPVLQHLFRGRSQEKSSAMEPSRAAVDYFIMAKLTS